jgi:phosphoribosylamine---glycine ligase
MNILLLGSGGREHAFAWKITQSKIEHNLFIAPGNAGTAMFGKNVSLNIMDFESVKNFCIENEIQVLIPCSEDPLVGGIHDYFKQDEVAKYIQVIGPKMEAAQLEGSKIWAKKFMKRNKIPTAKFLEFSKPKLKAACDYVKTLTMPVVIKADGLAAGKGVVICNTVEEAHKTLTEMMIDEKFGKSGQRVVIEEFLNGIEFSVFILTDGEDYVLLPTAKDYKKVGDGDTGPNTGGMGAVSPVPFVTDEVMKQVEQNIIQKTLVGLSSAGITYTGFLYFGLMLVGNEVFVIEYNCRMGDPETQVVFASFEEDLLDMMLAVYNGKLVHKSAKQLLGYRVGVVMCGKGYPGEITVKGRSFVLNTQSKSDLQPFFAGVKDVSEGASDLGLAISGGRVLLLLGKGENLPEAIEKAYDSVRFVSDGGNLFFRTDIGNDLVKWEELKSRYEAA